MKVFTRTLAVLLINSSLLAGCSMNRAASLRMLDGRAEYDDMRTAQEIRMREAGIDGMRNSPMPVRTRPKVAAIWIHAHEMASHDYFWGGWMSVVVEPDQWVLTKPGEMPAAPGILDVTQSGIPKSKKARAINAKPTLKK